MTLDPSFRGVVFSYLTEVLYENLVHHKNFTLRICRESMQTTSFVFYFTKNFYLLSEFDDLIERFKAAGLIDYVMSKYHMPKSMEKIQKQPPAALTYSNIE